MSRNVASTNEVAEDFFFHLRHSAMLSSDELGHGLFEIDVKSGEIFYLLLGASKENSNIIW